MTGAERLRAAFQPGRTALAPFFTAGYPDLWSFARFVLAASRTGADVVEVGLPFSDPLADGPSIQFASKTALDGGMSVAGAFSAVRRLGRATRVPLVLMGYANPILSFGVRRFAAECARADVAGVIVPDLPAEESGDLDEALADRGVASVPLLAPTSTAERIRLAAGRAKGFVYLLSTTGVTGVREALSPELPPFVARVRRVTRLPLAVGFGVSTPAHASALAGMADGIIVGSALVEIIRRAPSRDAAVRGVEARLRSLRRALDGRRRRRV
ncbi:MAG: tryptophan synthase subunit alpha [Planctomycetes bacterium]|nr:tryptophan synthase subunit alpha [Planctomycetota bacterium]